ncbi:MAG: alpha-amylase, partial [Nitriliruptorales bacterium]|nr:alpha-amylase [Nitriliruptorales bacterium]
RDPASFAEVAGRIFALGRDPHFPAWTDVVQVNAFGSDLRSAMTEQLRRIAERCDGVRCDMAMLLLNDVFAATWGARVGAAPADEFWPGMIRGVRTEQPGFLFAAEAYWDLEHVLLEQGFDYCYDKRLYDLVVHPDPVALRGHLLSDANHQRRMVRFLENHDEPRVAAALARETLPVAAVAVATLPGALLVYEGQLDGRRVRPPVQLGRRPAETADSGLREFWLRLLAEATAAPVRRGEWTLLRVEGWPDNDSFRRLVAWRWDTTDSTVTVVVNLSANAAQGRLCRPDAGSPVGQVELVDPLAKHRFLPDPAELADQGLYVDLAPWGFHFLRGNW